MYDFLRGRVANLDTSGNLSLEVAGVGYRLRVSAQTRQRLPLDGSTVTVHVRLVVREDDLLLFGFADPAERAAFDLLTAVQGVGPAMAMAVLSAHPVPDLRAILLTKDVAALRQVKGVGPKSAERMVLELHDKVDRIPGPLGQLASDGGSQVLTTAADEARQALIALGFGNKEAMAALAKVADPAADAEDLLRRCLNVLR